MSIKISAASVPEIRLGAFAFSNNRETNDPPQIQVEVYYSGLRGTRFFVGYHLPGNRQLTYD
jgi:hypothetical protein